MKTPEWLKFLRRQQTVIKQEPVWFSVFRQVKDAYPLGCQFGYLDRTMIVIGHREYSPAFHGVEGVRGIPATWPAIICEYADESGVIRTHEFGAGHWPYMLMLAGKRD